MNLNISELFEKPTNSEWLEAALKSMKLEQAADLEKKLDFKTCEGVVLKSNYNESKNPITLNTFPASTSLFQSEVSGFNIIENFLSHKKLETLETDLKTSQEDIIIDSSLIHNAGGSIVHELTSILSCLKFLTEKEVAAQNIIVKVSLDSLYFNNIAKLRALRFLGESLTEQCGLKTFKIMAENSQREQTLYDPWMNMLRNTASTASAFVGGADSIDVLSYDSIAKNYSNYEDSELGQRQARNIYHILNEESYLNHVKDPGAGSYVIESLTNQYIELTFEKFKQLESNGGFLSEITKFAHEVELIAKERKLRVAKTKHLLAGVNNFANTEETLNETFKISIDLQEKNELLFPLRRSSSEFEILRQKLEKKDLKIKILAYGPENKLSARLMFCANYFEVLGKKCEVQFVEKSQDLKANDNEFHILCSLDDLYEEWLADKDLSENKRLFIAGKKYEKEGVTNIFLGQNILEVLTSNFLGESNE